MGEKERYLAGRGGPSESSAGGSTGGAGRAGGPPGRALLDHVPEMVTISDPEGRIVYANPATERVSGYTPEEFVKRNPFDSIHPKDRPRCEEAFERLMGEPGLSVELEHRVRHRDGTWRWVEVTLASFFEESAHLGLLATVRDVTDRRRAEEALRDSEVKYRTLFDSIDEGFCVIEMIYDEAGEPVDWLYLEANPTFERQSGLVAPGKTASELVGEVEPFWFETYARVAETGEPERIEDRVESLDRWYSIFASRVGGEGSRRLAIVFDDVTERKRRELSAALLDEIGKVMMNLSAPDEIMQTVGARVGEALRLSGCMFVDVDDERGEVTVHYGWTTEDVPSLKQTFRLDDFLTEEFARANHAGETTVIRDTANEERTDAEAYAKLEIGAVVAIPFHWQGRWTACFAVTSVSPRDWRTDEVELFREISNRLFSRVERARAEAALRESEERYRLAVEAADLGRWELVPKTGEFYTSPTCNRHLGLPEDARPSHEGHFRTIHPDDHATIHERLQRAAEGGGEFEAEYRVIHPTGGVRRILSRARVLRDPGSAPDRLTGITLDVTEARKLEEERERARASELTSLAEDAERERISRELHDRVAHGMGVAYQNLQLHQAYATSDPNRAAEKLELAAEATKTALEQTRSLSAQLARQGTKETSDGLGAALRKLLDSYVPEDVETALSVEGDESAVPSSVADQAYLVMREAVRNAVEHSGCGRVTVSLEVQDAGLRGRVEDDGSGFDVRSDPLEGQVSSHSDRGNDGPDAGVGLRSMRERAELMGGRLDLDSEPGSGTVVEVLFPLADRAPYTQVPRG